MTATGTSLAGVGAAAALVRVAHAALRAAVAPGMSELELWEHVRTAVSAHTGEDVEAVVDLMSGPRTAEVGMPPSDRRILAGDAVLFDFAPRHRGWWADSCATIAVGRPSAALVRRHDAVRRALEAGLTAARPGARADDVDRAVRDVLARHGLECPHHTGHGVGAGAQQDPWLRPGEDAVLDEGCVIAIEPGAYGDGFGLRLEHLAVVSPDGAQPLTTHSLELS